MEKVAIGFLQIVKQTMQHIVNRSSYQSMITLLFFASLREQLGCSSLEINIEPNETIKMLIQRLQNEKGESWSVLAAENIQYACNQVMVTSVHTLNVNDEVAFFPPVTGG